MVFTNSNKELVQPSMSYEISANIIVSLDRNQFAELLTKNPGKVVIKFGAEWCGPCKQIEPLVIQYMNNLPETVQGAIIDIDESFDLYAFLKSKRMVNGIPVILCYNSGNTSFVPDDYISGADPKAIHSFFERVLS